MCGMVVLTYVEDIIQSINHGKEKLFLNYYLFIKGPNLLKGDFDGPESPGLIENSSKLGLVWFSHPPYLYRSHICVMTAEQVSTRP